MELTAILYSFLLFNTMQAGNSVTTGSL